MDPIGGRSVYRLTPVQNLIVRLDRARCLALLLRLHGLSWASGVQGKLNRIPNRVHLEAVSELEFDDVLRPPSIVNLLFLLYLELDGSSLFRPKHANVDLFGDV